MSLSSVRPIEYTGVSRPIPMLRLFDAFESRIVDNHYNVAVCFRSRICYGDSDSIGASNTCGEYD